MHSALAIAFATILAAHELPDQVVDRGVQLVVSKDQIEIQYEVGMNLKMVVRELSKHKKLPANWKASDLDSERVAELLPLIRRHLFEKLAGQMKLIVNQRPFPLKALRYVPSVKQHTLVRATFTAPYQTAKPVASLSFQDDNFPDQAGWLRIAVKPRGPISIIESSTAALLVRMTRDLEKPETAEQLASRRAVAVRFQVPDEAVIAAVTAKQSQTAETTATEADAVGPKTVDATTATRPHVGWFLSAFAVMAGMAILAYEREKRRAR